ncbi:MAG: hypothetical protein KDK91_17945 [Gammaproteobacteria bacterium]|nr:hypothetical protein [Gammaproteobacteria bacterium]
MRVLHVVVMIGLGAIGVIGMQAAGAAQPPADQAQHADAHGQREARIDVSGHRPTPSLSLEVTEAATGGWNVHLDVKNFRFAPEHVNGAHVPGEGHALLYVDGQEVTQLYGNRFHLQPLQAGPHTIRVALYSNNHGQLAVHDDLIEASVDINQ